MCYRPAIGTALAAVLGLAWSAPPAAADNYPRQTAVDAIHYVFRLTLNDDTDEIVGETTAELRFTRAGVTEAALDLASAANGKGMTVSAVTADGKSVTFGHETGRLRWAVDPPSLDNDRRTLTVPYRGVPARGRRI